MLFVTIAIVSRMFNLVREAQALDSLDIKIGQMILIGFPGPQWIQRY